MLASIGLDVNSTAVIIGAMLISPLMTPILGIGMGFGISDRDMIYSSIKNFAFAVIVSLATATIYFILTPLGQETTELYARTKPTLLDVGIALFGGIAGIVASSRTEKTSAIPGVAIATALMPPLCTAGFGIANGDMQFFFGAFYLFLINAFFISLATYLVVRYLKFPQIKYIDVVKKKKMQRSIVIAAVILILPSSYILYDVVVEARIQRNIQNFINKYVDNEYYETIRWESEINDSIEFVKLYVVGETIAPNVVKRLESDFNKYYIEDKKLKIIQMNVPQSERMQLKKELAGEVSLNVIKQMQQANESNILQQKTIDSLQNVMRELYLNKGLLDDLKRETEIVFPEINNVRFGLLGGDIIDSSNTDALPVAYISFVQKIKNREKLAVSNKLNNYLKLKFKRDSIQILYD
jgi:uncharacterized hydrophobic protein (TIGR00271 family)